MKKNILLVLMFIGMFFIGGTDVLAVKCTVDNCNIEELTDGQILCLYEVTMDDNKKYYNYIYYDKSRLYGETTYDGKKGKEEAELGVDKKSEARVFGENTYNDLVKNYNCPTYSYIDKKGTKAEVCFDSDGTSCKNSGKNIDEGTNFNSTISSKNTGLYSADLYKYLNLDYNTVCNINNFADKTSDMKICRYRNYDSGNQIYIYYNSKSTIMIYSNEDRGVKLNLKLGQTYEHVPKSNNYDNYTAHLTNISSCPSILYETEKRTEVGGGQGQASVTIERNIYISDVEFNKFETFNFLGQYGKKYVYNFSKCTEEEKQSDNPPPTICSDLKLFSGEIIDYINGAMTIIQIGVPILLIGLIIYDFASAVFASSEDKVKKAKERAIKRIIISIVIFFVPTLINFVFSVVNDVWGTKYEICGLEKQK